MTADTWEMSFSDHQPIYVIRKKQKTKIGRTSFRCRNFSNYDIDDFQDDLVNHDWSTFFDTTCPEQLG